MGGIVHPLILPAEPNADLQYLWGTGRESVQLGQYGSHQENASEDAETMSDNSNEQQGMEVQHGITWLVFKAGTYPSISSIHLHHLHQINHDSQLFNMHHLHLHLPPPSTEVLTPASPP